MSHGRSLPDTVTKSLGPVSSCRRTDRTLVQKIRFGHLDNKSERCFRVSTNRPALYTQDLTGYPDKESGPYIRVTSRLDQPHRRTPSDTSTKSPGLVPVYRRVDRTHVQTIRTGCPKKSPSPTPEYRRTNRSSPDFPKKSDRYTPMSMT